MLLFTNLANPTDALIFAGWALASAGLGRALLRSFAAQELGARLLQQERNRRAGIPRLRELQFELHTGHRWQDRAVGQDPLSWGPPLTAGEQAVRRAEQKELARATIWLRFVLWPLECWPCQVFWGAVLLLLAPECRATTALASLFAIAELMTLVSRACSASGPPAARGAPESAPTCGG